MIEFRDVSIDDKPVFDKYLMEFNPEGSEFTFTNFFMWRKYYNFRWTEDNGYLLIIAAPEKGEPYALAPAGRGDQASFKMVLGKLEGYFKDRGWKLGFRKVSESDISLFKAAGVSEAAFETDRDNSDYVYLSEDLINLKGKKFDGKRNHINRFKREHSFEYVKLAEEHVDECKRIMDQWCAARDCDCQKGEFCERHANIEVLNNYKVFNLKGALLKVDGTFEAFTVGEMLNSDTAVIHIEKANFNINGLYTVINQQFCEHEWQAVTYINREQDLGQEGLRKAKLSYNPVRLVNKYTVKL